MAQVFAIGRHVITKKTGEERVEIVYGVTSVRPERVPPGQLLAFVLGHWHLEHKSHWVRDVTFDADRSQVRCGHIPQGMAAACRRLAAQPAQALALIGIALEN